MAEISQETRDEFVRAVVDELEDRGVNLANLLVEVAQAQEANRKVETVLYNVEKAIVAAMSREEHVHA
jgi:hypothetical protein